MREGELLPVDGARFGAEGGALLAIVQQLEDGSGEAGWFGRVGQTGGAGAVPFGLAQAAAVGNERNAQGKRGHGGAAAGGDAVRVRLKQNVAGAEGDRNLVRTQFTRGDDAAVGIAIPGSETAGKLVASTAQQQNPYGGAAQEFIEGGGKQAADAVAKGSEMADESLAGRDQFRADAKNFAEIGTFRNVAGYGRPFEALPTGEALRLKASFPSRYGDADL